MSTILGSLAEDDNLDVTETNSSTINVFLFSALALRRVAKDNILVNDAPLYASDKQHGAD
jgi:kynureninase